MIACHLIFGKQSHAGSYPIISELVSDVCTVGAGPAGTTLARAFIKLNFQVCLWRTAISILITTLLR